MGTLRIMFYNFFWKDKTLPCVRQDIERKKQILSLKSNTYHRINADYRSKFRDNDPNGHIVAQNRITR